MARPAQATASHPCGICISREGKITANHTRAPASQDAAAEAANFAERIP